jgi:hypothetical protein
MRKSRAMLAFVDQDRAREMILRDLENSLRV